ncbi:MAG: hypothetical protein EWM72_00690 [Nitrospira sp.]|nr:MAG: hypothetical protein EWM72_00690 [Nitrospira sp.]
MLKVKWVSAFMILGFLFAMQSFAASPVESPIIKGGHQQLAMYYADQAQNFKAQARFWDNTAESYEHHPELYKASDIAEQAAHCRTIARNYRKMADEAATLASEHMSRSSKGRR